MADAANWLGLLIQTGIGAIAIWQDRIRAFVWRPKLQLVVNTAAPDCDLTYISLFNQFPGAEGAVTVESGQADCYFCRLRVRNAGKRLAEKVEVYVKSLHRKQVDGSFSPVQHFPPMNLVWSHVRTAAQDIPPGMEKFCDFGMLIAPRHLAQYPLTFRAEISRRTAPDSTVFSFELQVKPNHGGHVVGPGTYRVSLLIGGANIDPVPLVVEMSFSGHWYEDQSKMYSDGFRFSLSEEGRRA